MCFSRHNPDAFPSSWIHSAVKYLSWVALWPAGSAIDTLMTSRYCVMIGLKIV